MSGRKVMKRKWEEELSDEEEKRKRGEVRARQCRAGEGRTDFIPG